MNHARAEELEGDFSLENETAKELDTGLDTGIVEDELGPELGEGTEQAPPAEFPYPGAKDKDLMANTPKAELGPMVTERPKRIDEDDNYFYDNTDEPPKPSGRPDIIAPKATTSAGDYHYGTDLEPVTFSGRPGVERPIEITTHGLFRYEVEHSKQNRSASFRMGAMPAPALKNADTGLTFGDAYTKGNLPVVLGDYTWQLNSSAGKLGLKLGSGVSTSQGIGHFKTTTNNRRPDDVPQERYTFLLFPNTLTALYRFQYSDKQAIVPFIEGGGGYFAFTELRDDNVTPKIGGAAVGIGAGGVNFLLDGLDQRASRALESDYGVSHVWLTTEFRLIVGLNKTYDFSSSVVDAGVLLEF